MNTVLSLALLIAIVLVAAWAWGGFELLLAEIWEKFRTSKHPPSSLAEVVAGIYVVIAFLVSYFLHESIGLLAIPVALVILGWIGNKRSDQKRKQWQAEYEEKQRLRKIKADELYARYEANPYLLDNSNFLNEFIETGAVPSIKKSHERSWICSACGKTIGDSKEAHVDHIKPRSKYPQLRFLRSNLQILCAKCNIHKSAYDGDDWKEEIVRRKKAKAAARRKATIKARSQSH